MKLFHRASATAHEMLNVNAVDLRVSLLVPVMEDGCKFAALSVKGRLNPHMESLWRTVVFFTVKKTSQNPAAASVQQLGDGGVTIVPFTNGQKIIWAVIYFYISLGVATLAC